MYRNGEDELVFTSLSTISFEEFFDDIHEFVQADPRLSDYVLYYLITTRLWSGEIKN